MLQIKFIKITDRYSDFLTSVYFKLNVQIYVKYRIHMQFSVTY